MADSHSPVGSRFSQRILASQSLNREEKTLFAKQSWDQGGTEVLKDTEFTLGLGIKQHKHRGSTNTDKSSNATRNSSGTSKTGYRTSMEVAPVVYTTSLSKRKSMPTEPSIKTPRFSTEMSTKALEGIDIVGLAAMSSSPLNVQRPESPRRQMSNFKMEQPSRSETIYSGPLERFLAQEEMPLEFREWGQLRKLRANTLRHRLQLQEMRKHIRAKELATRLADEAFMKDVRHHRSASIIQTEMRFPKPEKASFDTFYEALQLARDECGPLNDEYTKLEDLLDQEEFEMAKLEGRLYNSQTHEAEASEPELLGVGLSSEPPKESQPLRVSYLSTLGDLDLAQERYDNITQERERLLYIQESRVRVGLDLPENDREFLDQFPTEEEKLLKEIAKIKQAVERKSVECLEAGIDLAESSLGDFEDSEDDVLPSKNASKEASHESSMFSLLLPKSAKDKIKLSVLITDFDEGNKSDRINRWIRYQLQSSSLEVELLVRIFLQVLSIADLRQWKMGPYQWQFFVLMLWEHDEANRSTEDFRVSYTGSSVAESNASAIKDAFGISHMNQPFSSETSKPIRNIRSAPESHRPWQDYGKEGLLVTKTPLATLSHS